MLFFLLVIYGHLKQQQQHAFVIRGLSLALLEYLILSLRLECIDHSLMEIMLSSSILKCNGGVCCSDLILDLCPGQPAYDFTFLPGGVPAYVTMYYLNLYSLTF